MAGMFNVNRTFFEKIYSMLDSGCSILEKSFIAENVENSIIFNRGLTLILPVFGGLLEKEIDKCYE